MCFSVISGIFLAEIEGAEQKSDLGWKRTTDVVGFWPFCTQNGFSGATELEMACFQLRWKVDIQGFPAIYNSSYFA